MTSPLNMPKRRIDHAATVVPPARPETEEYMLPEDPDPHCFVCGRNTDHFAEHDDLVDAGLARYTGDGSVHRTDAWTDDTTAAVIKAAAAKTEAAYEYAMALSNSEHHDLIDN